MVKVDCRKCRYFFPIDDKWYLEEPFLSMPKEEIDKILEEAVVKEAKGYKVLGVCAKRKAIVTYYVGRCRYYKPKNKPLRQLTLDEVLRKVSRK